MPKGSTRETFINCKWYKYFNQEKKLPPFHFKFICGTHSLVSLVVKSIKMSELLLIIFCVFRLNNISWARSISESVKIWVWLIEGATRLRMGLCLEPIKAVQALFLAKSPAAPKFTKKRPIAWSRDF